MSITAKLISCLTVLVIASAAVAGGMTENIPISQKLIGQHPKLLFSADQMKSWQEAGRLESQKFIWDAGAEYFANCGGDFPEGEPWNKGGGWQVWGWWWGTSNVFLYAKTGEQKYADSAINLMMAMCASEHWELGGEQDYGMGSGNIMATVALAYDVCYDLLSDAQRDIVRKRLLLAAKRFYEYGFYEYKKLENPNVRYWQNDPQNNHRWHRVCGYLLGTLAIYGEIDGVEPYLADAIKQAEFIIEWLPQDGTCHESVGYQAFGTSFLVPFTVALDRNTGSKHLTTNRAFREFPHFRTHMVTPDRKHVWSFGDGGESTYYFSHYHLKLASAWADKFMQTAHLMNFNASPSSYGYHAFALIWHDPDAEQGDINAYPSWRFFPDMGMATFRSSWTDPGALATFFKCSVYGGHRLNEFRYSREPDQYVNVAHDHPDANSFLVSFGGELLAQDFGTHDRLSSEHNTITVNGKSQLGSGLDWTQPIENMASSADIEQYFGSDGYSMIRGEAGNFYEDLSRYARTLVYVDDAYILVADDIRAPQPAEVSWYYNVRGDITELSPMHWKVGRNLAAVNVRMVGPELTQYEITKVKRGQSIVATASDVRRCGMLTMVSPVTDNSARLVGQMMDQRNIFARVDRGDKIDLVVVSSNMEISRWGELETDAECAVVTLADNKVSAVMIAGGTFLRYGDVSIGFDRPACAKLDVAAENVWVNSALGTDAGRGSVEVKSVSLKQINGRIVGPGGAGKYEFDMPTWQQLQDQQDGFNLLPVSEN